jgi:hypothetical protein
VADQSVPRKNQAYILATSLVSQANVNEFQNLPTLVVGDARINTYNGAAWSGWGNTTNAPAGNGERGLTILLTAPEMNNDIVHVVLHDAAGAEWQDQAWILHPTDSTLAVIAAAIAAVAASIAALPAAVWASGTRTLTSYGTLIADIWAYATRTLTSYGTLVADVAAAVWAYATRTLTSLGGVCADIWSCARRTLTSTFTSIRMPIQGDQISLLRGDTLDFDVSSLGNISTRANVWFTVKDDKDDADSAADIQIDENTGLLFIMGVAGTAGNGSIVVTDAVAGDLTITLAAVETAKLTDKGRFWYDIQWLSAAGVVATLTKGRVHIIGDVTRAVA